MPRHPLRSTPCLRLRLGRGMRTTSSHTPRRVGLVAETDPLIRVAHDSDFHVDEATPACSRCQARARGVQVGGAGKLDRHPYE